MKKTSTDPTRSTYNSLDAAYDHFNRELFAASSRRA